MHVLFRAVTLSALALAPAPAPSPSCVKDSDLCNFIFEHTNNRWLAATSYYLLVKPFQIAVIIVAALIIRHIIHKSIKRLVSRTAQGEGSAVLKPFHRTLQDAVFRERRQQRAEAIGSVLLSFAHRRDLLDRGPDGPRPNSASSSRRCWRAPGIAGIALGFGAQTLVKDLLAGLFMLLEDQYGVGDAVDRRRGERHRGVGRPADHVDPGLARRAVARTQRRDHPGRQQEPGLGGRS